ncbi:type II toxin-antitoxin system Phd/YefM family antitoxin [Patescibacteria group bacterium]|nr:type II toxin-antitoxin system Phd/YefM family antitoxin [Patescibacteria group bacterium]
MNILSTTNFRKNLPSFLEEVVSNKPIIVGRRNKPEVIIIKFPENLNKKVSDITNFNANSTSFDFLKKEPDIYSIDDLKVKYV